MADAPASWPRPNSASMDNNLIRIGDIEKFSIVDFPSKIAVVVFMQGCPWRCPFCYNQSLQDANGATEASWDNLLCLLEHRKGVIDAVVFSGGEPLLQPHLEQAIDAVKKLGFEAAMHTGGYNPQALARVINKLCWIGFDIKAPLEEDKYKIATGGIGGCNRVKESLQTVIASGIKFECRTTCDPRILNTDDIYKIADEISAMGVTEYYLQKYRPVESDKITTESDCEKFFGNTEMLAYLRGKFKLFDIRK